MVSPKILLFFIFFWFERWRITAGAVRMRRMRSVVGGGLVVVQTGRSTPELQARTCCPSENLGPKVFVVCDAVSRVLQQYVMCFTFTTFL